MRGEVPIDEGEVEVGVDEIFGLGLEVEAFVVLDEEGLEEHFRLLAVLAVGYLEE